MFAPLDGRVAGPEIRAVGGIREAEAMVLQELCCSSIIRFEHRNDSHDGEGA